MFYREPITTNDIGCHYVSSVFISSPLVNFLAVSISPTVKNLTLEFYVNNLTCNQRDPTDVQLLRKWRTRFVRPETVAKDSGSARNV
jgi:hypothetical protein